MRKSIQSSMKFLTIGMIVISCVVLQKALAHINAHFSPEKANFKIKFKNEISPYRIISVFVLPGEKLTLETIDHDDIQFSLITSAGKVIQTNANKWQWQAPLKVGHSSARILHPQSTDSISINIFVMVPYDRLKGEYLNGYRIGTYPSVPLKKLPIYKPPRGFIEVTKENQETLLSPHFKLKQFLCKQVSGFPKYVVIKERLLLKLELILERMNEKGYRCNTFHIMSGYRTPYYNKIIGNVKYSRHVWGGAADIFIDENPQDEMMDDLNKDGKINFLDAAIIYDTIDEMYGQPWYRSLLGGLGRYKKTASHGPFVHVDVRGFRARWGY